MSLPRVVVTGVGPVSALGNGKEVFWSSLLAKESGICSLERAASLTTRCGAAAQVFAPSRLPLRPRLPQARAAELARLAAELAWTDAGLDRSEGLNLDRVGVVVGTGAGNLDVIEQAVRRIVNDEPLSPLTGFRAFAHAAAIEVVDSIRATGPLSTVTTGCNSGLDAAALAMDWVRVGRADVVMVVGTEAELVPMFLESMEAGGALATQWNHDPSRASRPFDSARGGNIPGEGAGALVLESAEFAAQRGARAIAELAAVASLSAGKRQRYVPGAPVRDHAPMLRTMRLALADAQVAPHQVSAVSANGSSSVAYDVIEAAAYRELFGERAFRVPTFSIKGALGQTGACSPAFQLISAVLAIEHSVLPPTVNHERPAEGLGLNVISEALAGKVESILMHAIGFGGAYNASAVVRACD